MFGLLIRVCVNFFFKKLKKITFPCCQRVNQPALCYCHGEMQALRQYRQPDREIHVILWLPGGKNDAKTPGCKCVTEEGEKSQVTHQKSSSQ